MTANKPQPPIDEGQNTLEIQKIQATVDSAYYFRKKPIYSFFKRFFDLLVSGTFLILFCWLYLILAILVKCTSKGPVIYKHKRIGRKGKIFNMYKFRTMKVDNRPIEEQLTKEQLEQFRREFKVDNDPRITSFGRFLRKTSLDELPQLFNVFLGSMSIVGPRPIIDEETDRYGLTRKVLLSVRPGITSYWACHGRSSVDYTERINMELYYIKHRSLFFDFKILCRTIVKVFQKEGAQ